MIEGIIEQSLEVLRADETITNHVRAGIERSFEIPRRVEEIIDIIEAIEIHSVNTMIISKKTGIEGEALARISYEMGHLSRDANDISSRFAALIKDLNDSYEDFGRNEGGAGARMRDTFAFQKCYRRHIRNDRP